MPNTKISADPTVATLTGDEILPILQSATNKKTTISTIIKDLDIARFGRTSGVIDRLIDWNNVTVSGETEIDSWIDLLATYPPGANSGLTALVRNIADNAVGFPCEAWSDGTKWNVLHGEALLAKGAPNIKLTVPASTWVGTYTLSAGAGANSAKTKLVGAGNHGLTNAVAANAHIRVTGTTGAGTVDWIPGLYKLLLVADGGGELTLDYPYSASLRQPIFALENTEMELVRINVPPLSADGVLRWMMTVDNGAAVASGKTNRIRWGLDSFSLTSGTIYYSNIDSGGNTVGIIGGFQNNTTASQVGFHNESNASGTGSVANANQVSTISTTGQTQATISTQILTPNDIMTLSRYMFWVSP